MRKTLMVMGFLCAATAWADNTGKTTFSSELDRTVDLAVTAIHQREEAQMVDGVRPVEHLCVPGPGGRTAMAYARETPDGLTWPIVILIPGPAIEGKSPSVAIEATYEGIHAHHIGKMEWSEDGFYLAVLTQSTSLVGPGGELIVAMPGSGHAKRIDKDVTTFSMSRDGRWLVYEKTKNSDDQTGPRQLMVSDGATGQRKLITEVAYPKEQVAKIGTPDNDTGKAKITLRDYSASLANPKDSEATVDLVGGRIAK